MATRVRTDSRSAPTPRIEDPEVSVQCSSIPSCVLAAEARCAWGGLHPLLTSSQAPWYRLAINPLTYQSARTTGGEVHAMGEIWAVTLWDMYWNLVTAYGFEGNFYDATSSARNIVALQLVMDGLKLQPCSPTFLVGAETGAGGQH
jgi:Fungalysin metallopeptidase (M36)